MRKNIKKPASFIIVAVMIAVMLCGCTGKKEPAEKDLNSPDTKIAVEVSTPMERAVKATYPNAELFYVDSAMSGLLSLKTGKVDAYCGDPVYIETAIKNGFDGIKMADNTIGDVEHVAVAISRKSHLENAEELVNGFIEEIKADGTLEDMYRRWVLDGNYEMPDIPVPENPDKTIYIATSGLLEPFTFLENGTFTGFDAELSKRFAYYANAKLDVTIYDWAGLSAAMVTDKVDYGISNFYINAEAMEVMDFSVPYEDVRSVIVTADTVSASAGLTDRIANSFYKNFIYEGRWKSILGGLLVTVKISLLSMAIGTAAGFLICIGKRSKYKALKRVLYGITQTVKGIPALVILMILYYVIFTDVSPTLTAVMAFSLYFASDVSDIMKGSIEGIDKGQWEAAEALGFERKKAFTKFIVPQTMQSFLPSYISLAVALLHITSVVGYISIIDITYAVQLIRSRTFEPFFPLIISSVMYLLLSYGLICVISLLGKRIWLKSRLLKGVNTDTEDIKSVHSVVKGEKGETVIEVQGLKKIYPNAAPLNNLNCTVKRGDVIGIIGPSGTGKSTLLRCINRLEEPTEGSIKILGTEVTDKKEEALADIRRKMGMVFQNFNLFPHLNVVENIMAAPVMLLNMPKQEAYEMAVSLLTQVGLGDKGFNYPGQLSGGQKQRVAIARSLAMSPEIILFDEPTSALDPDMVGEVMLVINSLAKQGMTMMIVTHEMKLARKITNRVFYMDKGVVYEQGTPEEIFENPKTDRCRAFIHSLKVLKLTVTAEKSDIPGEFSKIADFGYKYYLGDARIVKMYQILEELCITLILPCLEKGAVVDYEASYDGENKLCSVTVTYGGEMFNPIEDEDDISVKIIKNRTHDTVYTFDNGVNRIVIKF